MPADWLNKNYMNIITEHSEEVKMDSFERKADLIEAKKLLGRVNELLSGCGEKFLVWDVNKLIGDVDDAIQCADEDCLTEQRLEDAALTRAFFHDAIGAFNRL